ncbi:MAG: DNA topoisomerase [Bifidobacterium crudilactis]|nr:DNA topoisomerase [Bifidobacterium crudilactis]
MNVIVAEKHSVANAIVQAIETTGQPARAVNADGYVQVGAWIVTWAQGHLIEPAMPQDYKDEDWTTWSLDALPIIPRQWQWQVSESRGAAPQYRTVAGVLQRADVERIVNACDPDREGEAIFARIIRQARVRKPVSRLWVASLEAEAIREALHTMKDGAHYRGLAEAAEIRAKADWLIGINASRAYSLVYNRRFSVGRVQTPTLAMVVTRDSDISNHTPTPYWNVTADMNGWTLTSVRLERLEQAEHLAATAQTTMAITSVERTHQRTHPPHLYDLTGLQKDMSRLHSLSAARTLSALQRLYERKLTTYPRTDSQYITRNDLDTLRTLVSGRALVEGFLDPAALPAEPRLGLTVNDDKVQGHTAILPTLAAAERRGEVEGDELLVLTRVVRRMWEAVADDCEHDVVNVEALLHDVEFTSRTATPTSLGWKRIQPPAPAASDNQEDGADDKGEPNRIPETLHAPSSITPQRLTIRKGMSSPPKPFTEASLLAAMEHASRFVDEQHLKTALDDDTSHSAGLGTPATRADTIEKLIHSGYLTRKGKQIRASMEGVALISVVDARLADVAFTARMEQRLSDVEHGSQDASAVLDEFTRQAAAIPKLAVATVNQEHVRTRNTARAVAGTCPKCGADVVKTGKIWQCSTNKQEQQADGSWKHTGGCGFKLFSTFAGKALTDRQISQLLEGKLITVKGLKKKNGDTFTAKLTLDKDTGVTFPPR